MHPGLYLISTFHYLGSSIMMIKRVNALSGLYIISTQMCLTSKRCELWCQCPFGLIHHFYVCAVAVTMHEAVYAVSMPFRAYTSFLQDAP